MFRYVALIWDDEHELRRHTAGLLARRLQSRVSEWRCALDQPGLKLLVAGERLGSLEFHSLPERAGGVVGTVFHPALQEAHSGRKEFSRADTRSLRATKGRSIIELCWGRYVAFIRDASGNGVHVIRDPSGALPCYHRTFLDVEVVFSAVDDLVRTGMMKFDVDWEYITARVAFQALHSRETALQEVTDVLPGERLTLSKDERNRSFVWSPFDAARFDPIEDPEQAACELRHVTLHCTRAWASCHSTVLHTLSGGLDSSIVLGCLAQAPNRPRIACLNFHSPGCDGDERTFARLAAHHNGCALIEKQRSEHVDLANLLTIERSCTPTYYLNALGADRDIARMAEDVGASAIMGGGGGDQLFYQTQPVLSAVDRLLMHGIDSDYLRVALDTAHLARLSIWSVIIQSVRIALRLTRWDPRSEAVEMRKLVCAGTLEQAIERGRYVHPLFEQTRKIPPGKLWHAWSLSIPQEFYAPRGHADDAERIQPLISQPLLELCLRMPTYVLTADGWDRSVARRAFHREVPRDILTRRSKGGIEEHAQEILARNIGIARDLLLNGHLAARGIVDRDAVAEVLSGDPTRVPGALAEIFDHLSTEAWLRRWYPMPLSTAGEERSSSLPLHQ